jgi:hypothetical protein
MEADTSECRLMTQSGHLPSGKERRKATLA